MSIALFLILYINALYSRTEEVTSINVYIFFQTEIFPFLLNDLMEI